MDSVTQLSSVSTSLIAQPEATAAAPIAQPEAAWATTADLAAIIDYVGATADAAAEKTAALSAQVAALAARPIAPAAGSTRTRSEDISALAAALSKAQGSVQAAARSGYNSHLKANYSTLGDIVAAAADALAAAGIAVHGAVEWTPPTNQNSKEGALSLTLTLLHGGQFLSSTLSLPSSGDPKSCAAVLSYLRRMSLLAALNIVSDDDSGDAPKTGFTR